MGAKSLTTVAPGHAIHALQCLSGVQTFVPREGSAVIPALAGGGLSAGWVSSNPLAMRKCSSHAASRESEGLSALWATVKPWQGQHLRLAVNNTLTTGIYLRRWGIWLNVCNFFILILIKTFFTNCGFFSSQAMTSGTSHKCILFVLFCI